MTFTGCETRMGHGGGLHIIVGSLTVESGAITFQRCRAPDAGGGAMIRSHVHVRENVSMTFERCRSARGGGQCAFKWLFLSASSVFSQSRQNPEVPSMPCPDRHGPWRQLCPAWCVRRVPKMYSTRWPWRRLSCFQRLLAPICRQHEFLRLWLQYWRRAFRSEGCGDDRHHELHEVSCHAGRQGIIFDPVDELQNQGFCLGVSIPRCPCAWLVYVVGVRLGGGVRRPILCVRKRACRLEVELNF